MIGAKIEAETTVSQQRAEKGGGGNDISGKHENKIRSKPKQIEHQKVTTVDGDKLMMKSIGSLLVCTFPFLFSFLHLEGSK